MAVECTPGLYDEDGNYVHYVSRYYQPHCHVYFGRRARRVRALAEPRVPSQDLRPLVSPTTYIFRAKIGSYHYR